MRKHPSSNALFLLLAALFLSTFCAASDTISFDDGLKLVRSAADSEGRLYKSLSEVMTASDIPDMVETAKNSSSELAKISKQLSAFESAPPAAICELWSAHATRRFEISGTDDINRAFERLPPNLVDSAVTQISPYMPELQSSFSKIQELLDIDKLRPGPAGTVDKVFDLRDDFVALISKTHREGSTASPVIALELEVSYESGDGRRLPLYVQYVAWNKDPPDVATIRDWIVFEEDSNVVTFKLPDHSFQYELPYRANKPEQPSPTTR